MTKAATRKLHPPEAARRLGISARTAIELIRAGQLPARNIAVNPNGRPRYVIDEADLARFEEVRSVRTQ